MVKNMRPFFLYVGTRPFGEKVIIFAKKPIARKIIKDVFLRPQRKFILKHGSGTKL
jgi:hypothetical protein